MSNRIRVASVNMTEVGSTGNIMCAITELANQQGFDAQAFTTRAYDPQCNKKKDIINHRYYGCYAENTLHTILGKVTGYNGCFSYFGTKQLIRWFKKMKPDVIHLHNLHKFCIHLPVLFRYIKKNKISVIWTLHDCWSFTGHCPHFDIVKCEKWKTGCHSCLQYQKYPKTYVDRSKNLYALKKKWFGGVENMTLVTPSRWLADLVQQSFLKEYPVKVIHNGIDLSIFKPTPSDFREKYGIAEGKSIILGVAFDWGKRKGLDVFLELFKRLDGNKYQIVMIGTNEAMDTYLPKNIISIHRTTNQEELAKIYTAADVYVNPTREDNFPTVNIEAIACGTPVITFNTGGSPESLDETCGSVVPCDDVDAMEREIIKICSTTPYTAAACVKRAKQFDKYEKYKSYLTLYSTVSERNGSEQ